MLENDFQPDPDEKKRIEGGQYTAELLRALIARSDPDEIIGSDKYEEFPGVLSDDQIQQLLKDIIDEGYGK